MNKEDIYKCHAEITSMKNKNFKTILKEILPEGMSKGFELLLLDKINLESFIGPCIVLDFSEISRPAMPIRKQEFYEGAALQILARGGQIKSIVHEPPFFHFNDTVAVLMKYCTKAWAKQISPNFSGPIVLNRYGKMMIGRI